MDSQEPEVQPAEPNQETLNRFYSAYASYLQAVQLAWMAPDVQQNGTAAYQEYARVLEELMEHDLHKRVKEAWNAYVSVLEKTLSDKNVQAHMQEAYRQYIQSVQQAWAETDLEGMNGLTLAAISQSLGAASWLAAAANGHAGRLNDSYNQSISPPG